MGSNEIFRRTVALSELPLEINQLSEQRQYEY